MSKVVLEPHVEKLLKQRYYISEDETWSDLVSRVIDHVCVNEDPWFRGKMWKNISERVFLPNSPCLVNAGKENSGLFACFVAGPGEDDLGVHLDTLKDIAEVAKAGGGCGFTGTFIRPENSPVAGSAHGYAYGPNNFALQVNNYMDMMTQAGFRKMALMYTLRSDHPDLDKFIDLKQADEVTGALFNQSVMATDRWMETALENPNSKAAEQLLTLARNAWNNGEPGLLFYDTINERTPYKTCGCRIETSNPCGEQCLPEYGSCNLGSINIAHDVFYDGLGNFNFDKLVEVVGDCTQFLDNVGSTNKFPNEKFAKWYADHRPVGLGLMGYADALMRLEITYGSDVAVNFLSKVMKTMLYAADDRSKYLGVIRGVPEHIKTLKRRNVTVLSIAPTGSISFIANCSSSIEPIFAPTYTRKDERGEYYSFNTPGAERDYFRSAINDDENKVVTWREHVKTQLAAQAWVDSAISKTINFPESATVDEVYEAMIYAWRGGAKGITVYRNNSRQSQVLTTGDGIGSNRAHPKRPKSLRCDIHTIKANGSRWLVLVGLYREKPFEVFVAKYPDQVSGLNSTMGRITKVSSKVYSLTTDDGLLIPHITIGNTAEEAALARMISLLLRSDTPLHFIVEQLNKSETSISSFAKAIKRVLALYTDIVNVKCEDCGSKNIASQGGCFVCLDCGSSKCG